MAVRNGICLAGMLIALLGPGPAVAEMTLTVTSTGDGVFFLQGAHVDGVEAVDITVDYDTTFLANPQAGLQGGAFTNISADTPGKVSMSVFREDPDAVLDLDLNFEKRGDSLGVINYVTATMRDTEGRSFPVSVTIIPPPPPLVKSPESVASGNGALTAAASPVVSVNGSRWDDGVPRRRPDGTPVAGAGMASAVKRPAAKVEQSATTDPASGNGEVSSWERDQSVLQRFREFRGKKGLRELAALFDRGDRGRIVQEPAIALSDGKTPVNIELKLEPEGDYAPNFALSDAKFLSLHRHGEKSWVMTIVPNKGAWDVRLLLRAGKDKIEFPLVVAPPVKILDHLNEKNFLLALNRYLSDQAVRVNGESDPFRQYLHEYIFTANYLANLVKASPKQASR